MRPLASVIALSSVLAMPLACEPVSVSERLPPEPVRPTAAALGSLLSPRLPRPVSSEAIQLEQTIQARKLRLEPKRQHEPRLAFGKGMFGQLTTNAVRIFDTSDFRLIAEEPLEGTRVLVSLADGALLAVGARAMLRWQPGKSRPDSLSKPVLLPGTDVYADPVQADRFWIFDGQRRPAAAPPTLSSIRLVPDSRSLLLPEQTISLGSPRGGVFGTSREGVWLYFGEGGAERLSPGGLRLPGLKLPEVSGSFWVLPARRLDQCFWFDGPRQVSRVVVTPKFRRLASVQLPGDPFTADVADEGRVLAVVAITAEGPRFELLLFTSELEPIARVALPQDTPTGRDDWVRVVTQNQGLVAAAREPRLAVGGPDRVLIFDARGAKLFSIPSR